MYAVFGLTVLAVFAITYFNPGPRFELAMQMVMVTGAVFIAVDGLFRRDPLTLLVAAGAGVEAYGLFTYQRIFFYIGMALFLGAFLLVTRRHKTMTPGPTGV
jgi:hypothetical protein